MLPFLPAGWTPSDVERELIDAPAHAWVPFDGLTVIDRPDWLQLTCTRFPTGGLNEISRAKLSAGDADRVIDETLAHYAKLGLEFRWSLLPGTTPSDLGARLAARGLIGKDLVAMARSTECPTSPTPGVTVERVDARTIDTFTRVMCEGWGAPIGALGDYNRACLGDARHRLWLAYVDGAPAGTAASLHFERSAYLLGGVVLPEFRRRGVYGAMTEARLSAARGEGLLLATTRAMAETSAPLLSQRGWDAWFRFESYALKGQAAA